MTQRSNRRNSKATAAAAAEVVDLVDDSDDDDGDDDANDTQKQQQQQQQPAPPSSGRRSSKGRAAAAAAAAAIAATAQQDSAGAQQQGGYDGSYDIVDSDFEVEAEEQEQQVVAAVPRGRKRSLSAAAAAFRGPKGGAAGGTAGDGGGATQPAAKRAKTAAAAGGGSRGGGGGSKGSSRPASSKGRKGPLSSKQASAKGFGALFLCASQHTGGGGSQGSADAGGSSQQQPAGEGGRRVGGRASPPAAAAAALQVTATSAALAAAAAAAAGGGGPVAAAAAAGGHDDVDDVDHGPTELWVDKHMPHAVADLVVQKRKVAEVQDWLQFYLQHRAKHHTRALLVTGPPGCGKSVTIRAVAASLGFDVMEWTPPVPTLWSDHQYMAGAGVRYTSKLDEFDMFVARCKFAALPLSSPTRPAQQQQPTQQQQQTQSAAAPPARAAVMQKLILIEDLPHVSDVERRGRVAAALSELATTARCPVVVVATTEEGGGGRGAAAGGYGSYGAAAAGVTTKGLHKDFVSVLEQCGAGTIGFNPITDLNLKKALLAVADAEGYSLDPLVAAGLVQGAAGDLRNAIQNLQLLLQGPQGATNNKSQGKTKKGKGSKAPRRPRNKAAAAAAQQDPEAAAAAEATQQAVTSQVARDQSLSVFHAIGKLLHYKRQQDSSGSSPHKRKQKKQTQQTQLYTQVPAAAAAAAGGGVDEEQDGAGGAAAAGGSQPGADSRSVQQLPLLRINPEAIIQGSGLEALQVTSFLAENYTHFFSGDAMDEVAEAATHLSDAAYLCCYRNTAAPSVSFWDEADPNAGSLSGAAAVSVAARGLLWSNRHPAVVGFMPLKGPSCFMPERAATSNMARLGAALQALQDDYSGAGISSGSGRGGRGGGAGEVLVLAGQLLHAGRQDRAAQVLPYLQTLSRAPSRLWLHALLPRSWSHIWAGSITERASTAMQGPGAAAVQAALEAAAAEAFGRAGHHAAGAGAAAAAAAGGCSAAGVGDEAVAASEEEEEEKLSEIEDSD